MNATYSFVLDGATITEDSYGHGKDDEIGGRTYLEDLWSLAETHAGRDGSKILEWGSGISTLMFADFIKNNGGSLTTLDDNATYQQSVISAIGNRDQVRSYAADLIGARESQSDRCLNYSCLPLCLEDRFDFIYIDGRRRVECSLIAAMVAGPETTVVVHDYRRSRYQPMLGLFDVIDDGAHFRVMRVKPELLQVFSRSKKRIFGGDQDQGPTNFRSKSGVSVIYRQ